MDQLNSTEAKSATGDSTTAPAKRQVTMRAVGEHLNVKISERSNAQRSDSSAQGEREAAVSEINNDGDKQMEASPILGFGRDTFNKSATLLDKQGKTEKHQAAKSPTSFADGAKNIITRQRTMAKGAKESEPSSPTRRIKKKPPVIQHQEDSPTAVASFTRIKNTEMLGEDINRLDGIRPYQWFNIPAPVVDAVTILLEQSRMQQDRIKFLTFELQNTKNSFDQKQKRNKQSINEVLEYCKEEIGTQAEALTSNFTDLQSTVKNNSEKVNKQVNQVKTQTNSKLQSLDEMLNSRYITEEATKEYIDVTLNQELRKTNNKLFTLQNKHQIQIDELYYNHVSVPGIINPTTPPTDKSNTFGQSVRGSSVFTNESPDKALENKRKKYLRKFEEKRGAYETLPNWIKDFENQMKTEIEGLKIKIRDQEAQFKQSQEVMKTDLMAEMASYIEQEQARVQTQMEGELQQLFRKMDDRMESIEITQTDSKGFMQEMVDKMKSENDKVQAVFVTMNKDMLEKTEKINWFERKLNKWVKLFEESEVEQANRHNDMVGKVNEVDSMYNRECRQLNEKIKNLIKQLAKGGSDIKIEMPNDDSSDNVSNLSRQTAKRLKKVDPKKKKSSPSPVQDTKRMNYQRKKTGIAEFNSFKMQDHALDGSESPVKLANRDQIVAERQNESNTTRFKSSERQDEAFFKFTEHRRRLSTVHQAQPGKQGSETARNKKPGDFSQDQIQKEGSVNLETNVPELDKQLLKQQITDLIEDVNLTQTSLDAGSSVQIEVGEEEMAKLSGRGALNPDKDMSITEQTHLPGSQLNATLPGSSMARRPKPSTFVIIDQKRASTVMRDGTTNHDSELGHLENLSHTQNSIPQTAMIDEQTGEDVSGDVTDTSVANLFNNARLNKQKLPPLQGLAQPSRGQSRDQTVQAARERFDTVNYDSFIDGDLKPMQDIRKNIVLNVQPKAGLRGSQVRPRNQAMMTRATTQAKAHRSKLAPLEVKFQQL